MMTVRLSAVSMMTTWTLKSLMVIKMTRVVRP